MNGDPGFWHNFLSAIAYSALGIAIYIGGLMLWDWLTPRYDIWRAIYAEKNLAMAVLVGAFAIGIAIILAAAIHG
jgi:putative membrane protein